MWKVWELLELPRPKVSFSVSQSRASVGDRFSRWFKSNLWHTMVKLPSRWLMVFPKIYSWKELSVSLTKRYQKISHTESQAKYLQPWLLLAQYLPGKLFMNRSLICTNMYRSRLQTCIITFIPTGLLDHAGLMTAMLFHCLVRMYWS